MPIRLLTPSDALAYQSLRLAALRDCPSAFSSSYDEECDTPLATIAGHMAPDSGRWRFGAFDGEELVAVVGVGRESSPKLLHKAYIRGMYVTPIHRGAGLGRRLLEQALACCAAMPGLRQVTLSVTGGNQAAIALYEALGFTAFGREPAALLADGLLYHEIYMQRLMAAN